MIVCEYLDFKGNKKGDNAQILHMWKCRTIINKLEHNSHKYKMRFSKVNPKNTSRLAFDGSGYVKRDKNNASLCVFPSGITPKGRISYAKGKKYNCDLNASYNIGARYFIREILKSSSEKKMSQLQAKAPEIVRRTQCTLSTLKLLVA
ncbi:MAG: transposase [Romboutsia sp.]|nr:transposase [Romboutsia sp.]